MKKLSTRQIFSQMLSKLRKDRNISRSKLADDLGVSVSSIGYYENADRVPDIEVLVKIADYFNVTCDELLKGVKSPNKNIYKDLWLSDRALNTLREIKEMQPLNPDTQISRIFEFFNDLLEDCDFKLFLRHYYEYAIGFDGQVELNDLYSSASEEAQILIDLYVGVRNIGYNYEFKLFAAMRDLERFSHGYAFRNLNEYESYYSYMLDEIEARYGNNEISKEVLSKIGKHQTPKE